MQEEGWGLESHIGVNAGGPVVGLSHDKTDATPTIYEARPCVQSFPSTLRIYYKRGWPNLEKNVLMVELSS